MPKGSNVCTWEGCGNKATVPQIGRDGKQWANLCADHDNQFDQVARGCYPKPMIACWIKAQGGSAAAARRMTAGVSFIEKLTRV